MTTNVTLTDSSSNVVTIGAERVGEAWVNQITDIPIPKTRSNQDDGLTSKLVNLMRLKRTFTLNGLITVGGDSSDFSGTDTAQQQRTKLRNMMESTENVDLVYGDVSKSVGILRLEILEDARDEDTPTQYEVRIMVIQGTNVLG